jgi:2-polyprenyl-3-methyl-5-hydroxy-6-metoxy-1,4-benzoquinol methylase
MLDMFLNNKKLDSRISHAFDQEFESRIRHALPALAKATRENKPNLNGLAELLRDLPALRWNTKVMGSVLAKALFNDPECYPTELSDKSFELAWQATQSEHFKTRWLLDTCKKLKIAPLLHRKVWELAFILNTFEQTGKLQAGQRGIGFGCGEEDFPSYFASQGVSVLATDLAPDDPNATQWLQSRQHSVSRDKLFKPQLVSRTEFDRLVSFQNEDMTNISQSLSGGFDFCWSVCAFEHLGSIEKGLAFIENSMKLLRPGGVSVHTTEFNFQSNDDTVDNWPTVLFRKRDFEELASRLQQQGYIVPRLDFSVGEAPVDMFIDMPPYPHDKNYYFESLDPMHLKLMIDGFACTCYGLVVIKP